MKPVTRFLLLVLLVMISSCDDVETVKATPSEYVLIGDSRQGNIFSNVAKFSATSKSVSDNFDVDFWIRDAIVVGEDLFAFEFSDTGRVWRMDLEEMQVTGSMDLPILEVFTTFLSEYNDQIFVFGIESRNDQFLSVLGIYSKDLDRIGEVILDSVRYNTGVLIANDLLFMGLTDEAGESVVKVFDLSNFTLLDEFSIGTFLTSEFLEAGGLVYAFDEFGFYTINLSTLERTFFEEELIDIGLEKSPSVVFGEVNNFYFLDALPQPSPVPFQLAEYSFEDNQSNILIGELGFVVNFPINYDSINNVVLLNGGRRLMKVTTASGFNQIDVDLPL